VLCNVATVSIYLVIVLTILGTAVGSVPTVNQLLDRFAANADNHSGSFIMKLESDREVVIERMEHPFFKPGKRREQYTL
jgi:outer membrane lipoprotein-sorting protein